MKTWQKVLGGFLVALLDISIGVFFSLAIARFVNHKVGIGEISFGVISALWLDLDSLSILKKGAGKWTHEHRDLLHLPLIVLPVVFIVGYVLLGGYYAMVLFLATFSHLIHDSSGIGWGIKWLYPFSFKNYKVFGRKFGKLELIAQWTKEELKKDVGSNGDNDWLKNLYLSPSVILFVETGLSLFFIIFSVVMAFN